MRLWNKNYGLGIFMSDRTVLGYIVGVGWRDLEGGGTFLSGECGECGESGECGECGECGRGESIRRGSIKAKQKERERGDIIRIFLLGHP